MATVVSLMLDNPSPDVTTRSIATYVDASRLRKLWVGIAGMVHASWVLFRGDADLLHVHLAHGGSVLRKALPMAVARRSGIPVVVHAHSYDFAGWFDGLPRFVAVLVRRALAADEWLVLGNELTGEYAARLGVPAESMSVLYNPVRIPVERAAQDDISPIRVVTLGRLGTRKGSFDLIKAVAALPHHTRERLTVTMCGDGVVDEVRAAARAAGLDHQVDVAGWTSPEECAELLSTAHVFALPSYSEGLPMALLEAMSHGVVPVCTPVGSVAEAVTTEVNGILVQPGSIDELSAALNRLVEDGVVRRRLAEGARRTSTEFDVDLWYRRLNSIWRTAVLARTVDQPGEQRV